MVKITDLRLDLTSYCNQRCDFCPFHGYDKKISKGDYINLEYYIKIADDLKKADINPKVRLVGSGEPILYPWFKDLVKYYHDNGLYLKLITNGQKILDLPILINKNIDSLIVSLHGNEKTHNKQVNSHNSYQNIIKGVQEMRSLDYKGEIILHFVITPQNYVQLIQHVELCDSLDVKARFQHLVFTDGNKKLGNFDIHLLKKIINEIKRRKPNTKFVPELNEDQIDDYYDVSKTYIRNPNDCKRILTDLSLRFDGKVIMCDNNILGDITKESIIKIINGKKRSNFIEKRLNAARSNKLPDSCSRCCYN